MDMQTAIGSVVKLKSEMNTAFPEREDEVDILVNAVISEEHVFFLGLPGTAKSLIIETFLKALDVKREEIFKYQFGGDTTADEVFGPYSIQDLKKGNYVRLTDRMLPTARFGYLDEIFKANSTILNKLLSIINERVFYNGKNPESCPLDTCFSASNEMPAGEELDALFDRFLFRRHVLPVAQSDNFTAIIRGGLPSVSPINFDVIEFLRSKRDEVCILNVEQSIFKLHNNIKKGMKEVSVRRWAKAVKAVKTSAMLAGRTEAKGKDLMVLKSILWTKPQERPVILGMLVEFVGGNTSAALKVLAGYFDVFVQETAEWSQQSGRTLPVDPELSDIKEMIKEIREIKIIANLRQKTNEIQSHLKDLLEDDPEISEIVADFDDYCEFTKNHIKSLLGV